MICQSTELSAPPYPEEEYSVLLMDVLEVAVQSFAVRGAVLCRRGRSFVNSRVVG